MNKARQFYETEALRCGWTVRQLDRQISSQFYERTALSKNKVAMLRKSGQVQPDERLSAEEEIKDPFVLEFLGLKGEYSDSDLEAALIRHLGERYRRRVEMEFPIWSRSYSAIPTLTGARLPIDVMRDA